MARATQQRTQRRQTRTPDDASRADSAPVSDPEDSGNGSGSAEDDDGGDNVERAAGDLVRLALFTEGKRIPLKRDEISKKVLKNKNRKFKEVFDASQKILRGTFGMELVELPSKAERDAADKAETSSKEKKKAPVASRQYILRSTLDLELLAIANEPDPQIRNVEQAWQEKDNEERPEEDLHSERLSEGAILAWCTSDHYATIGLLYTILALILGNGKELPDAQLRHYLKTLRVHPNGLLPYSVCGLEGPKRPSVESFLANATRQGYLDKIKLNSPAASQQPAKRGRVSKGGDDGDAQYIWKFGPRSLVEIGETNVCEWMVAMMDRPILSDDEDEGQEGGARQRAEQEKTAMRKSIVKAAGGSLVDY